MSLIRCGICGKEMKTLRVGLELKDEQYYGPASRRFVDLKGCMACGQLVIDGTARYRLDGEDKPYDLTMKNDKIYYSPELLVQLQEEYGMFSVEHLEGEHDTDRP